MKKLICILLGLGLLLLLPGGCAREQTPDSADTTGKINIVSTIFAPYDFAREIAGDYAAISMLVPPGTESHSYEPSPQDIIKVQNCDIFIHIGGESDAWVREILQSVDTGDVEIVTLLDCADAVQEEFVDGMQRDEHDHGDDPASYDEHIWTSPKNAMRIVQKLTNVLCQADGAHAAVYQDNAAAYLVQLEKLDTCFAEIVDTGVRKTIVFGDRFPFRYFTDAYGLDYFAAFPGCAAETEASAATVAFLIDKINQEKIPVVFHVELSSKRMAQVISDATGAHVQLFHACHNVTHDELAGGATYLSLMYANADNLRAALS